MAKSEMFYMRITPEDRARLRALALLADRTESDVLRVLIRAVQPSQVSAGLAIPVAASSSLSRPGAEAPALVEADARREAIAA